MESENFVLPAFLGIDEGRTRVVYPEDPFSPELCVESAVLKKTICNEIMDFMRNWSTEQIVENYTQTRPHVNRQVVEHLLTAKPSFVLYSGSDLLYCEGSSGQKEFMLIETNSFTAGQDAMPPNAQVYESHLNWCILNDDWERTKCESGGLAHMFGRKTRRDYAYPHFMAQLVKEPVHVVPMFSKQPNRPDAKIEKLVRFVEGTMQVKSQDEWLNIRACFYTMNYRPWSFIPVTNNLKTYMCPNPIAGLVGKNKILAEYAFQDFNKDYSKYGLQIRGPKTVVGLTKKEIRRVVEEEFKGRAVIKTPYDAQGRGIYVIRNGGDLDNFYATDQSNYSLWVVQELIGAEKCPNDRYQQVGYHLDGLLYAYSLRIVACHSQCGFKATTICCARAPEPFARTGSQSTHDPETVSGLLNRPKTIHQDDVYVTNIGTNAEGELRSFYLDDAGMKGMGVEINSLVDGFMQTVYSIHAIDNMCRKLTMQDGELNLNLLKTLNPDPQLLAEILTNWK